MIDVFHGATYHWGAPSQWLSVPPMIGGIVRALTVMHASDDYYSKSHIKSVLYVFR